MLKSFSVDNFRIFDSKTTIDFSATGNYEFNPECVKDGVVKTAIVYGKNAKGKSSLAYALFDIVANLTDNFMPKENYFNYLNAATEKKYAEFEYVFQFQGKEARYIYKKIDLNTILSEKLILNGKTVVEYDRTVSKSNLKLEMAGTETLNANLETIKISLLKYISSNAVLSPNEETNLFSDLMIFANKMLLFWSLEGRSFIGFKQQFGTNIIGRIIKNNHFNDMNKFFREAGFDDEIVHKKIAGEDKLFFKFSNNKMIDFNTARSTGMSSLLLFYYWLEDINVPEKAPSFVCIDEFDAFYHFELSRFVVEKLKKSNVQVLLTTHNTSLLTNDLLRPDCYYICSKNKIVNAHNATQKELREGHNLEKLYKGGTFGE